MLFFMTQSVVERGYTKNRSQDRVNFRKNGQPFSLESIPPDCDYVSFLRFYRWNRLFWDNP